MRRFVLPIAMLVPVAALGGPVRPTAPGADAQRGKAADPVCRAVKALTLAQGDLAVASGGRVAATWEWQRGSGQTAENAAGIVATALARSAAASPSCADSAALSRFAQARAARHAGLDFLYDPDVEALALAAEVLHDARYRQVAREAFDRRYGGATGEEIVARWAAFRRDPSLLGYDTALAIRAAVAVGAPEKAREIAEAAVATLPRWGETKTPSGFLTTSRGAFLEALASLDAKRYAKPIQDLVHHLVLAQDPDGSWVGRNTQATAYAVSGLLASGHESGATAARRGQQWLRKTQLPDGSWASFNDGLPEPFVGDVIHEVTAEALLALAAR